MIDRLKRLDFRLVEVVLFGLVGLAATAIHFVVAIGSIEWLHMPVWLANIAGFLVALPASYLGHAFLTFSAARYGRSDHVTRESAGRFFLLATSGFAVNEVSVVVFTYGFGFPHRPTILVTLFAVAGFLFLLSKFWAYKGKDIVKGTGL